jgi:hypothetical protein
VVTGTVSDFTASALALRDGAVFCARASGHIAAIPATNTAMMANSKGLLIFMAPRIQNQNIN